MSIFAIVNPSPAAGRTTTAVGLAAYLGAFGARVLLVDCDPQADATAAVERVHAADLEEALERGLSLAGCIAPSALSRVDLMRASHTGRASVAGGAFPECLGTVLEHVAARYSYILVDCPAAADAVTRSALTAAHGVIVPVPCEHDSRRDVRAVMQVVDETPRRNPRPQLTLVMTMVDDSLPARELMAEMRQTYGGWVCDTAIPRDDLLAGVLEGQSLLERSSPGARAYQELAMEVASRAAGAVA